MAQQLAKERQVKQKRAVILNTALKIFARDGYADTDVQVIADLAGVGKGTVYRHFGNKQELFLATARHSQEMLGEFIRSRVNEDAPATPAYARLLLPMRGISNYIPKRLNSCCRSGLHFKLRSSRRT